MQIGPSPRKIRSDCGWKNTRPSYSVLIFPTYILFNILIFFNPRKKIIFLSARGQTPRGISHLFEDSGTSAPRRVFNIYIIINSDRPMEENAF